MDWVHEGVHGPGPQGWSMVLGSMFCIRPFKFVFLELKPKVAFEFVYNSSHGN